MQKKNYVQEILDIIHSGLPQAELAEKLSDYHENDLADALADLTTEERRKLYALLGVEQVAEIFSYLDAAAPSLKELPPEEPAGIKQVPSSLAEAMDALEEDHAFLTAGDVFTDDLIETWIGLKRDEIDQARLAPTPLEYELYFHI